MPHSTSWLFTWFFLLASLVINENGAWKFSAFYIQKTEESHCKVMMTCNSSRNLWFTLDIRNTKYPGSKYTPSHQQLRISEMRVNTCKWIKGPTFAFTFSLSYRLPSSVWKVWHRSKWMKRWLTHSLNQSEGTWPKVLYVLPNLKMMISIGHPLLATFSGYKFVYVQLSSSLTRKPSSFFWTFRGLAWLQLAWRSRRFWLHP